MSNVRGSVTLDTYGHLMPGSEAKAAALLDVYLKATTERLEDQASEANLESVKRAGLPGPDISVETRQPNFT